MLSNIFDNIDEYSLAFVKILGEGFFLFYFINKYFINLFGNY